MYKQPNKVSHGSNARWKHLFIAWVLLLVTFNCSAAIIWYVPNTNYSIARNWNERALEGIRMDTPHPPVHARNLFTFSVCMYDAWAAYDTNAVGFIYRGKHTATDVAAARRDYCYDCEDDRDYGDRGSAYREPERREEVSPLAFLVAQLNALTVLNLE